MTFDNETEDFESQDVNETEQEVETSPTEESEESEKEVAPEKEAASQTQEQQPAGKQYVPYERFQELIEQKNQFAKQLEALQRQVQETRSSQPEKQAEKDALLEEMRKVNPAFAERFEKLEASLKKVNDLNSRWEQSETQTVKERAINMITSWHTQNKVSSENQEIYNAMIDNMLMKTPGVTLDNLRNVYDSVHSKLSKIFETRDRLNRQNYVTDKKKDASVPSMPKGKAPASQAKKSEWSANPDDARAQMVKRISQQLRADRET